MSARIEQLEREVASKAAEIARLRAEITTALQRISDGWNRSAKDALRRALDATP